MDDILRLRDLRLKHGLSQVEIAKRLCCDRTTYWRWESKIRTPRPIYRREIKRLIKRLKKELEKES